MPPKKKIKEDVTEISEETAIADSVKELLGDKHKKFNILSLYRSLKEKGIYKNPNDLLEKMQALENKEYINISGAIWAKK